MNQLNTILIEGNITRNPEVHISPNGVKICKIPIAVNRFYKNTAGENVNEVSYFDIETYKTMADYCEKESEKGRGVRVKGRLKQNRWDSSDGKTNSRISIVAENIEFKTMLKNKTKELEAIKEATKSSIAKEHEMELSDEDMLEAEF